MEDLQEPLSLATFEPENTYEPYLNTPRSLEACRLNGVNPIELVAIPISEFQKDFPNDPDAVQRRFERIDGARKRTLEDVVLDWKRLCASGWSEPINRLNTEKEAILQVPSNAHCTLLEIQAARFRKIEQENWEYFNRSLKIELKNADIEQKNKKILQKHNEIQTSNDNLKKERALIKEFLYKEELENIRRKEEEEMIRIRKLQQEDRELAFQKKEEERINLLREKQAREQRETDRVLRGEYTRQLKNSIISGIENKAEIKKKVLSIRDKNTEDRLSEAKKEREAVISHKKETKQQRLQRAREDQMKFEAETKQEMIERMNQTEAHRQKLFEEKERQKEALAIAINTQEDPCKGKLQKIREATAAELEEKAAKVLRDLQTKEELAQQELEKVKEAQNKRRFIKTVRQEAFEMAKLRAKKAQDYKLLKLHIDIRNKDERCAAIRKGFFALDQMRNSMKDIMDKTNAELKNEMNRLRHRDSFSPDKVVQKALEVGNHVLFPRLEQAFGLADSADNSAAAAGRNISHLIPNTAEVFPAEFSTGGDRKQNKMTPSLTLNQRAQSASAGDDNNATTTATIFQNDHQHHPIDPSSTTTTSLNHKSSNRPVAGGGTVRRATTTNITTAAAVRKGFGPLPIQTMNNDRLQQALKHSKFAIANDGTSRQRKSSPNASTLRKRSNSWATKNGFFDESGEGVDGFHHASIIYGGDTTASADLYHDYGDNDDDIVAIMKLPRDDDGNGGYYYTADSPQLPPVRSADNNSDIKNARMRSGSNNNTTRRKTSTHLSRSSEDLLPVHSKRYNPLNDDTDNINNSNNMTVPESTTTLTASFNNQDGSNNNNNNNADRSKSPVRSPPSIYAYNRKNAGSSSAKSNCNIDETSSAAAGHSANGAWRPAAESKAAAAAAKAAAKAAKNEARKAAAVTAVKEAAAAASKAAADAAAAAVQFHPPPPKPIRTDVNNRAVYLEPPPGQFRREFSLDHPLAKNGTGKYSKELHMGRTPSGGLLSDLPGSSSNAAASSSSLSSPNGKRNVGIAGIEGIQITALTSPTTANGSSGSSVGSSSNSSSIGAGAKSLSVALNNAAVIEKLTYTAQRRIVDPDSRIDALRQKQNATLKQLLREEREAEEERARVLASINDSEEQRSLKAVFSEERRRASDRIMRITRENEEAMKEAVLQMMDLGGGAGGGKQQQGLSNSGSNNNNKLPPGNFFQ